jgi:drug/metabolite transporter (DMT)-like permease
MVQRRPGLGYSLVLVGALLFVLNAGVSRVLLRSGVDPASLTTARITGTAAVLLVLCLLFRRTALRPPPPELRWLLLLHGVVGVAALQWAYFVAIDRLPIGMALLLEYLAPVLVALWARFVQSEHLRPRAWVGLALALTGLAMATGVVEGQLRFDGIGVLAGLAAAVCFATYFLVGEHGVAQLEPVRMVLWSFGIAAVAMNLVDPVWDFPVHVLAEQVSMLGRLESLTAPAALLLLWVVVMGTLLPFGVELSAMSHLSASTVTTLLMLEPVGVAALGWVWFHEGLGAVALVGCSLVMVGVIAAQTGRRAAREPAPLVGI